MRTERPNDRRQRSSSLPGRAPTRLLAAGLGSLCLLSLSTMLSAAPYPPAAGTDRDSDAYLTAAEEFLGSVDLDDPDTALERLGGTTATNWALIADGERIANLKCTSGNTDHRGAVIAYRLGRELGFRIYPVAVYRDVERRIGDRQVSGRCALKEWDTVFTQYYWTRNTFTDTDSADKRRLIDALRCENPKPGASDAFRYYARSAYGHPPIAGQQRVPYSGTTKLLDAARDFSNMMVIDTLIGNEDRFPGGNLFFRSVTTSYRVTAGTVVFDDVRLFSLDNEAAFKGSTPASTHAARDLNNHLSRFDGELIAALERLAEDPERLAAITDGDGVLNAFILAGIRHVLDRHAEARRRCGPDMAVF